MPATDLQNEDKIKQHAWLIRHLAAERATAGDRTQGTRQRERERSPLAQALRKMYLKCLQLASRFLPFCTQELGLKTHYSVLLESRLNGVGRPVTWGQINEIKCP